MSVISISNLVLIEISEKDFVLKNNNNNQLYSAILDRYQIDKDVYMHSQHCISCHNIMLVYI